MLRCFSPFSAYGSCITLVLAAVGTSDAGPRSSARDDALPPSVTAGEPHGDCFGSGPCCEAHASRGCEYPDCCLNVCLVDSYCCTQEWDEACVLEAEVFCGLLCTGGCPGSGDCCVSHGSAGCGRKACCERVCRGLPFCCIDGWDERCANLANEACVNVCDCASFGDFDDNGGADLFDLSRFLNCFSGVDGGPVGPECACADYDGDDRVTLADFAAFFDVFTAP